MNRYDAIVIGGGPAGAMFARKASSAGLIVLVVDGQAVGRPKPCGGLLSPDAQQVLARLDLTLPADVLVDPQIFAVKTVDVCAGLVRYYPRQYLNMDRLAFDRWLLSLSAGRTEILAGRCTALARENQGFRVDIRLEGGETVQSCCRWLVGADGADSLVRKTFFPNQKMRKQMAIQQWFPRNQRENPFYSCIFDAETSPGCSWSMVKDDFFLFGGTFSPRGCRAAFERQKERLDGKWGFHFPSPIKTEACLVNCLTGPRDFVAGEEGVFLVGEAAGLISPSSYEGISYALLSGQALGSAMSADGDILAEYNRSLAGMKRRLLTKMAKRALLYHPLSRRVLMASGITAFSPEREEKDQKICCVYR